MWDIGCLWVWPEKNFHPLDRTTELSAAIYKYTQRHMNAFLHHPQPSACAGGCHMCESDHRALQGAVQLASSCGKLVVML